VALVIVAGIFADSFVSSSSRDLALGDPAIMRHIVLAVSIAPITEEVFFRGIIQQYIGVGATSIGGIAVATLLFVSLHLPSFVRMVAAGGIVILLLNVAILSLLSILLGYSYMRTENLVVPICLHAVYNVGIVVAIPLLL
jgi:hypothetical protein